MNFIERVLENKMSGKDAAIFGIAIVAFVILIGVLLSSMGIKIKA